MSTPGAGNADGERGRPPRDTSGGYVPGAYSADEDDSGDYVPGMYSGADDSADNRTDRNADRNTDTASTRQQDHTPRAETRQQAHTPAPAAGAREQEPRTQAVPVSATKHADDGGSSGAREHRLPRTDAAGAGRTDGAVARSHSGVPSVEDRKILHQREKEHFGGIKFGAGFFGWLTATGLFVLLSALVGGFAALFSIGGNLTASDLSSGSAEAQSMGITTAVVLGVILLLSYYAGGYVAGRMARFSGIKQGVAVWLWAVIVAVVLGVLGLIIGNQAMVTQRFEQLGVPSAQDLAGPGLIGLLAVAVVALIGAILGGVTGMRYHRKIDRTDFDALEDAP